MDSIRAGMTSSKRPTIADLAREAGVSVATVDRVLNKRHPVREETARRVLAAAEAIDFYATGLIKHRLNTEVPHRTLAFLLQKGGDHFYRQLAADLAEATRRSPAIQGHPFVEFMDELVPSLIARKLREAGSKADAVAVVAVDHPHVNEAIEDLHAKGVPVFSLLSDLTSPARTGHVGVDSRRAGRVAGWTISRLARKPGTIGILVGSHRYLCQELSEISFRTYLREHAPAFHALEPIVNLDENRIAYEATIELLTSNADLVGIYAAGGGMEGMIDAIRDEKAGGRVVAVCNELIPSTRAALIEGVIDLVLSTPTRLVAAKAVELMAAALAGSGDGSKQVLLPAQIYISENI
jgi:LacI family transcriptional regulator